jgi:hypothetical protein
MKKVYHEEFGLGQLIKSTAKLDESGSIASGDVVFDHGVEVDLPLFEITYSAKKARKGMDIGKPGKQFKKIAAKAAAKYGSKAAGGRVAGAILKKLRKKQKKLRKKQMKEDTGTTVQGTESSGKPAVTTSNPYKKGHLPKQAKRGETYGEKAKTLDEKLVGGQKNIDKNKNGKIDSQDFKMLRGEKKEMPCEDVNMTPAAADLRMPVVENTIRSIMSNSRNLRKEAKLAEFKSRS